MILPANHSFLLVVMLLAGPPAAAPVQERISDTVHNLSVTGPGLVRAQTEQQVCIFCHAPHHTEGVRPLWNREMPVSSYQIYESSTLNSHPGQPAGSSKLCLSCHDGTIALGSVLSRNERIRMQGGDFIPAGLSNLGTDLSDDHPVSFAYTAGLAATDRQLASPATLPPQIKLDHAGGLQCTSCHDPHRNSYGQFLVAPNEFSALCVACHVRDGWPECSHRISAAPATGGPAGWPYATVAENACRSCHRPHTAARHERLLIMPAEEDNCLVCHDGGVSRANIRAALDKPSSHDPRMHQDIHDPAETAVPARAHVECTDCHNAHAVAPEPALPGYVPIGATLRLVRGVTIGGAERSEALNEYEICLRCHGDAPVPIANRVSRHSDVPNLRLRFNSINPSYHPVAAPVSSTDTVSLISSIPHGSLLRCTDCHNADDGPRAGGAGTDGPHGSAYDFLLEKNYTIADARSESEFEYSMCYKCHRRASILGDQSFRLHRKHIVDERSPCSACHDPHGVSNTSGAPGDHTHLINFDTRLVRPESQTGRMEFLDLGRFAGSCTVVCHGETHRNESYGQ